MKVKAQPLQPPKKSSPSPIIHEPPGILGPVQIACLTVLTGVFALTLISLLDEPSLPHRALGKSLIATVSFTEIGQNLRLLFEGYMGGYGRTLKAYLLFACMSGFFLMTGNFILARLFKFKDRKAKDSPLSHLSALERFALSYLLGSLAASLLWFALGVAGFLNASLAWSLAVVGGISFFREVRRLPPPGKAWATFTAAEKVLAAGSVLLLLWYSLPAFFYAEISDVLVTHISIPSYFIGQGSLAVNPYHYHTYLPLNTEMLVMWALLLKSEFAAGLLVWGFLAASVLLLWGFLGRHAGRLPALLATLLLFSAPVIGYSATYIKNDTPSMAFLLGCFFLLSEAFEGGQDFEASKRWMLLSGIFLGGAVGHKIVYIVPAVCSSGALLFYEIFRRRQSKEYRFLSLWWASGILAVLAPWLLRTFTLTGNPLYPFFGKIVGDSAAASINDPIYQNIEKKATSFVFNPVCSITPGDYLRSLLMLEVYPEGWRSGYMALAQLVPGWGPSALFALLVPIVWLREKAAGIKRSFFMVLAGFTVLLLWLEVRYHEGLWAFLVCVPFAFAFQSLLHLPGRGLYKGFAIGVVLFCLYQMPSAINRWAFLASSFNAVASGNTPGNYLATCAKNLNNEPGKTRWVSYAINTRTNPGDTVLFAEVHLVGGLERKMILGSAVNTRDPFMEVLEKAGDAQDLIERLKAMGVDQLVVRAHAASASKYKKNDLSAQNRWTPRLYREKRELLGDFFDNHTQFMFWSPDRELAWFSLDKDAQRVVLTVEDVREYPAISIEEAVSTIYTEGNPRAALPLLQNAGDVPMSRENKSVALYLLAIVYRQIGDNDRWGKTLDLAAKLFPDRAASQFSLGLYYDEQKNELGKAAECYLRAIKLNPDYVAAYKNLGNVYVRLKDYPKALEAYGKAASLNPKSAQSLSNMGSIHYSQSNFKEALKFYLRSYEADPKYSIACKNLANTYTMLKQPGRAQEFYARWAALGAESRTDSEDDFENVSVTRSDYQ